MFKNYLKIALRNLLKHKSDAFISISGLAIGIACCILILLYVHDELTFDGFHQKADHIYRAIQVRHIPDQGDQHFGITEGPLGPALANDFPEVSHYVRLFTGVRLTVGRGATRLIEREYFFTEPGFFDIFDFQLLQGDPKTALGEPGSVILTKESAKKYFGDENPYGKTLAVETLGDFRVTGVVQTIPGNSHLNFTMLFSFASIEALEGVPELLTSWERAAFITYVALKEGSLATALEAKFPEFIKKYRGEISWTKRKFYLQPLADIHFHSSHIQLDSNQNKGEMVYIYILSAIAFFIMLIACINYMNLATARAMHRAKEVGMRKVIGAQRWQLIGQFLSESVLLSGLALLVAIALVELVLPAFNQLAGKELILNFSTDWLMLLSLTAVALLVGIISGSFPAFHLSKLQAARVIKGETKVVSGKSRLRSSLVVTQFTLSITMMVATLVVYDQLQYVRNKRLGFNKEHLVVIDINSAEMRRNAKTAKNEFAGNSAVRSVAVSSRVPGDWKNIAQIGVISTGVPAPDTLAMSFLGIEENFLDTYEIELVEGRNFSTQIATDSTAVLLNETAAKALGWDSSMGKPIAVMAPRAGYGAQVIGVVKDFHFRSLYEKIGPLVMGHLSNPIQPMDYFTVRINAINLPATLEFLQSVHEQFDHTTPFEYNFLDERLQDFYKTDERVGRLFGIAAALAILIACIGLFGLAAFTTEQRTKEIGVRKVLGASAAGILLLLSKDFTKLVAVAFAAATPISYLAMKHWIQDFAYRSDIDWRVFALAGGMALLIVLLTVSYQAVKAAMANPVEALRYE